MLIIQYRSRMLQKSRIARHEKNKQA
jgi:hypothetical protein